MFEKEAHHLLLFLNNINKIEVYEKESAKTKPKLLMSVSVATPEALYKAMVRSYHLRDYD